MIWVDALKAIPIEINRKETLGTIELVIDGGEVPSIGWFRPAHRKSLVAPEVRAMLKAGKLLQAELRDVDSQRATSLSIIDKFSSEGFLTEFAHAVVGHKAIEDPDLE